MQIHQLMDAGLFAASFWLAYALRADPRVAAFFHLDPVKSFESAAGATGVSYSWLILIPTFFGPLILEAQGFYNRPILCARSVTLWQLFRGCLFVTLGLVLAMFLFRIEVARSAVIWFGAISLALVLIKEEVLRLSLERRLAKAQYRRRFILVGTRAETARMRKELQTKSQEGLDVVAELTLDAKCVEELVRMLHEYSVNSVILSAKDASFEQVEAAIWACEVEGVEAWLVADFFKTRISRTSFDDFYGQPVVVFSSIPEASWQSVFKSVIDVLGALVLVTLLSPFLVLIGLAIKFTSRGPVLFRQKRAGLNGQPFTMYKFRTMVTNAEQLQGKLAANNEMSGPVFKITKDPRVTPIGRLLRKRSIDELPQLFNVLRREMSLVGPRPLPLYEVKRFEDPAYRRRLSVKPGLTCLWQISGRNQISDFKDWVRLDLEYIDNWSLWLDVKILCRTVPIVLTGTGAR